MTAHLPRTVASVRRIAPAALCAAALAAACLTVAAPTAGAQTLTLRNVARPAVVVTMHGRGHGHGMSQWGAQGAAKKGLSYRRIVAFYYPHTKLHTLAATSIRVRIGKAGTTDTVAAGPTLAITGRRGTLSTRHVARYRLAAGSAHTEVLQRLASTRGAKWRTVLTRLANNTEFFRRDHRSLRLFDSHGTSSAFLGRLRAVRRAGSGAGAGVITVNRLSLDSYVAGVVPRESPRSWRRQALEAQAVAARTYGYYAIQHPRTHSYDICDTNSCQVYGGHVHYAANSKVLFTDDARPARDTARKVLTYKGKVIFAQFDGSNGGWTAANGEPYLIAKRDPYDSKASGDPWITYRRTVTAASIAKHYRLTKLTKITVTKRDGHGTGGGRVLAGYVYGYQGKKAKRIATTGNGLADALGSLTTWFTLRNA